jgi:nucleoid-associated protein YejK
MAITLENMIINRVIIHEIPKIPGSTEFAAPRCYSTLILLDVAGLSVLSERLKSVLGKDSQCLELQVKENESGEGTVFQECARLARCSEDEFITKTQTLTRRLVNVQTHPKIPGGIVLIATGTVGASNQPFVTVVKAEIQDGFSVSTEEDAGGLELIQRLVLTPQQRFYKTALLVEIIAPEDGEEFRSPEEFEIYVFDNNLAQSQGAGLARYFYDNFLGCKFASTAKRYTKDFYNFTGDFIDTRDLSDEEKKIYIQAYMLISNHRVLSSTHNHLPKITLRQS